jgi:regulator of cell morphogenesis and NO signaling
MRVTRETTIGEIVSNDFRTAAVFQEFGIDFCCGGRRTLADACRDLDEDAVLTAVERVCEGPASAVRFDMWSPQQLIGHIVANHHAYVRRALPSLIAFTQKLAAVHGSRHPELAEIARITEDVAAEMTSHMAKEERVLFPYIGALSEAVRNGVPAPPAPFGPVENPIRMMEEDHDAAGAAMARIRELTSGYAVPEDGCTTYRVCLEELNAFERDLHEHVHLENNILFPAARKLASPIAAG